MTDAPFVTWSSQGTWHLRIQWSFSRIQIAQRMNSWAKWYCSHKRQCKLLNSRMTIRAIISGRVSTSWKRIAISWSNIWGRNLVAATHSRHFLSAKASLGTRSKTLVAPWRCQLPLSITRQKALTCSNLPTSAMTIHRLITNNSPRKIKFVPHSHSRLSIQINGRRTNLWGRLQSFLLKRSRMSSTSQCLSLKASIVLIGVKCRCSQVSSQPNPIETKMTERFFWTC